MLSKARKWASTSIGAPLLGNLEGRFFLTTFLVRGIFVRFWKICKMPSKRVSLSIGALLENLEGGRLPGFLREKIKYILVLSLEPKDIKILSLGAVCNFSKGTGLSWVDIRLWGAKGPSIRPRCIGTIRARTQC